ncbi:hypothetical protein JHK87_018452 [Glycine soja]|nr:hypothetical protein JHK87_018452 [Glycine soja]
MDPGLEPHHPSGYCDRHPEEQFIGYCPECLYEELTVHDENSSTSTQVESHATSSIISSTKAIFQPFTAMCGPNRPCSSSSFLLMLRRTKSLFGTFKSQRKSNNFPTHNTLLSLFNQDDEYKIPREEPEVEMRNLASSSSIVQEVEEDRGTRDIKGNEIIEEELEVEAKETPEAMKDTMDLGSQANKSYGHDLKGIFQFVSLVFKKKLQKNGGRNKR